ncbi:ImmA/IrrE family metallo-endopeptidase [Lysobacter sp. TAF61]|uniref:ImmA/IrrE family metallo-endopeptidase n=1 Tax=Lysobacter sp. TAF61 TaxID=3233072 RepID=UPI003F9D3680
MAIVIRKLEPAETRDRVVIESLESLHARLRRSGLLSVPLNVHVVAEFLGLEVSEEVMDDDISGFLEYRSGRWVVGVNSLHHSNRQRFTIAHEIAHYILHRDHEQSFVDQTFARRSDSPDRMERDADRFAAELLMPESEVRKLIDGGCTSLQELAAKFKVSALAMRFRVQSMSYQVR